MSVVKNYLSLIKFSHTIFAMPFALIGFSLGIYQQAGLKLDLSNETGFAGLFNQNPWVLLGLVVLCMVFARSAAMAFNRYLDRQFDAKNPRTAIREIPAGVLKADSVLLFTIFCSVAFIVTTWFINTLCFYLSPIALLVVLGYSYTKRFTALCHIVLGIGLSLAPIGAYLAVTGAFDWLPLFFSFTVICWVSGFDIIYALQDEEFDKNNQLHSIPAALGKARALAVSRILHVASAAFVICAGLLGDFTFIYWIGVAVFIGMLFYQHSIVKPTDLKRVNIAFMTANGIASVVFAVFVIADIFFG